MDKEQILETIKELNKIYLDDLKAGSFESAKLVYQELEKWLKILNKSE